MNDQGRYRLSFAFPITSVAEMDPLQHKVIHCRLIAPDIEPEKARQELIEHHIWTLRWVSGSRKGIEVFFREARFEPRTTFGVIRYLGRGWRLAWNAEAVLLTTPQARWEFVAELVASVLARVRRCDCILYSEVWGETPGFRNALRVAARWTTFRLANTVVVPGTQHAATASRLVRAGTPIRVVGSPYCDRPEPRPLLGRHCPLRLLYCGRIFPLKGLDILVEAVHRLRAAGREIELTIVDVPQTQWSGSDGSYRQRCLEEARTRLGASVRFREPVRTVEDVFRGHHALVMPNREMKGERVPLESWGRILEEALTCGLPVIATDAVAAAHDLIVDGVNGFMVRRDSVPDLVAAIDALTAFDGTRGV